MKIGIVGLGGIVPQCLDALQEINGIECVALCVREPKVLMAEDTAKKYKIDNIYTNYNEMLVNKDIEFIYIGIINSLHYEYAKKALEYGKHVITEKPFTSTIEEAEELIKLAKQKNLFLFEAITLLYSPNYKVIREQLTRIGDIKLVQCNFSQYSSRYQKYIDGEVMPVFNPKLSGGALYDINIYNVHFVMGLFGEPIEINYLPNLGYNGIDTSGILTMKYNDFNASLTGAKDSSSPSFAVIQGTQGYIRLNSSANVCLSVEIVVGNESETINLNQYKNHMVNEFIAFEELYRTKQIDKCYEILEHSKKVIKTVVKAREYAGIVFDADIKK